MKEKINIDDGIGSPDLYLAMSLLVSWLIIMAVLTKGIHSSGKAAYFLAIFPYIIMLILLVRSVTLEGAMIGIMYFITPQWDRILEPKVWFAAVTQVFFSLSVCFGNIIMYSSYNKFRHNVHRYEYGESLLYIFLASYPSKSLDFFNDLKTSNLKPPLL